MGHQAEAAGKPTLVAHGLVARSLGNRRTTVDGVARQPARMVELQRERKVARQEVSRPSSSRSRAVASSEVAQFPRRTRYSSKTSRLIQPTKVSTSCLARLVPFLLMVS